MKLHPIVKDISTTLWCGPGALATITGKPVSECMDALRKTTWSTKPIKGVTNTMMIKAGAFLGVKLTLETVMPNGDMTLPTLAAWTRENKALFAKSPVIVNITGHFVTVLGRSFNDNHTKNPVSLKKAPHRRARVRRILRVEPWPEGAPLPVPCVKAAAPVPIVNDKVRAMRVAKRAAYSLARTIDGLEIDRHSSTSDVIWVYPPPCLAHPEEKDRYAGDHACYDWHEVLTRTREYAADYNAALCAKTATSPEAI